MTLRAVTAAVGGSGSSQSQFNSVAFASLPSAASSTGLIYSVSDINNSLWRSDGTIWKPIGGVAVLASSAAAVSCGADTTEDTLATITVPANCMGPNGALRIWPTFTHTNSSNTKTLRVRFSGASGTQYFVLGDTTSATTNIVVMICNRNSTSSQTSMHSAVSAGVSTGSSAALVTSSVDTTAATTVLITGQKDTSGETLTLQRYTVELIVP